MSKIRYQSLKPWKYRLYDQYTVKIPILPDREIVTQYLRLAVNGQLTISKGYAWDGPSGPTVDTKSFMRGSLVHDALYQFMGMGKLPWSLRDQADKLLQQMCREDGMSKLRAWWVYHGVSKGYRLVKPFRKSHEKLTRILEAP